MNFDISKLVRWNNHKLKFKRTQIYLGFVTLLLPSPSFSLSCSLLTRQCSGIKYLRGKNVVVTERFSLDLGKMVSLSVCLIFALSAKQLKNQIKTFARCFAPFFDCSIGSPGPLPKVIKNYFSAAFFSVQNASSVWS